MGQKNTKMGLPISTSDDLRGWDMRYVDKKSRTSYRLNSFNSDTMELSLWFLGPTSREWTHATMNVFAFLKLNTTIRGWWSNNILVKDTKAQATINAAIEMNKTLNV